MKKLTVEQHKQRHVKLHQALDELAADYFAHTGRLLSATTVMELMQWSCREMLSPTPVPTEE